MCIDVLKFEQKNALECGNVLKRDLLKFCDFLELFIGHNPIISDALQSIQILLVLVAFQSQAMY